MGSQHDDPTLASSPSSSVCARYCIRTCTTRYGGRLRKPQSQRGLVFEDSTPVNRSYRYVAGGFSEVDIARHAGDAATREHFRTTVRAPYVSHQCGQMRSTTDVNTPLAPSPPPKHSRRGDHVGLFSCLLSGLEWEGKTPCRNRLPSALRPRCVHAMGCAPVECVRLWNVYACGMCTPHTRAITCAPPPPPPPRQRILIPRVLTAMAYCTHIARTTPHATRHSKETGDDGEMTAR